MLRILLFFAAILWGSHALAAEPIIYSKCKRTTENFDLTATVTIAGQQQSITRTLTGLSIYDNLPDTARFLTDFTAPCDLVYRDAAGVETVIYDCSTTSTDAASCAALDGAVSFDGQRVAFSVFKGTLEKHLEWGVDSRVVHPDADQANIGNILFPNRRLQTTGAHLMLYDIGTGTLSTITPFMAGTYDSGPTFDSTTELVYTSNRSSHTTDVVFRSTQSKPGIALWKIGVDGKNNRLLSYQETTQVQHPIKLTNGWLAYSRWDIWGATPIPPR